MPGRGRRLGARAARSSRGDPDAFLARLRRLGEVTGEMHTVLASDPLRPGVRARGAERGVARAPRRDRGRGDRAIFLDLPETDALEPIAGRGEEVRERLRLISHARRGRPRDPHHGDFHLGQVLWTGERLGRARLRGRAGAVAAGAAPEALAAPRRRRDAALVRLRGVGGRSRGVDVPEGWEERARERVPRRATSTAVDRSIVPPGAATATRAAARSSSSRRRSTSCATSSTTGPTGSRIPVPGSPRLLGVVT